MLQRNAGPQSQVGVAGQGYLESQTGGGMGASRAIGAANVPGEHAAAIGEQHLIFSLVEREFAIQAECVQGVERLNEFTVVPNVASWVTGVINLRGSICSVVDLRAFLDLERLPNNPRVRLLSVKYNEMLVCLVVDSVSEMVPIHPNAVDSNIRGIPQWIAPYSSGMAMVGKRQVILLDPARLLFADKMHHYSA